MESPIVRSSFTHEDSRTSEEVVNLVRIVENETGKEEDTEDGKGPGDERVLERMRSGKSHT